MSLQTSYVEILTPKGGGIGRWTFGRCSGHAGGAPMYAISALLKEASESSLTPSTM